MAGRYIAVMAVVLGIAGCGLEQMKSTVPNVSDRVSAGVMIEGSQVPAEPVRIKEGGLYYLAGDRQCKETGIIIEAENVTIDMRGFQLAGPGIKSGQNYGILTNNYKNLEVRNGTIKNFGDRGIVDRGKQQETGQKRIINVSVVSNGACGICIGGSRNEIRGCICSNNVTNGICPGENCIVADNTCSSNGHNGILAGRGCLITGNVLSDNGQSGISAYAGCMVSMNTALGNNKSDSAEHAGIKLFDGNSAQNNTIRDNYFNNVFVKGNDNVVENNTITASDRPGNGIYLVSSHNRCPNNTFSGNKVNHAGTVPEN